MVPAPLLDTMQRRSPSIEENGALNSRVIDFGIGAMQCSDIVQMQDRCTSNFSLNLEILSHVMPNLE